MSSIKKLITFIEKNLNISIDKKIFTRDIYYLNLLVFKLYKIYSNNTLSYNDKLSKIMNLRDPQNNIFLTKQQAKYILDRNAKNIYNIYNKLYNLKKNAIINKKNNLMYGGNTITKINDKLNSVTGYLNDPETEKKTTLLFNWIFFPLWSLEHSPFIGPFVEIPLDILTIILDNLDVIMEMIAPIVPIILDTIVDVGQAIPAYGTAVSAVAIPLNFLEGPIEELIANYTDIIGMFINIARKDWGLAYMSALAAIPVFADIMDAVITNAYIANKWLLQINDKLENVTSVIDKVEQNIQHYTPIANELLENPNLLLNPTLLIKNIIIPNKDLLGLETFSNKQLTSILDKITQSKDTMKKIHKNKELYNKDYSKFYKDVLKPYLETVPENHTIFKLSNTILQNINHLF